MSSILIDHTADLGIQVFGPDPKHLFENAAHAMFDLITDGKKIKGEKKLELSVYGSDRPDLMVNWLRELLYLWAGKEMLVKNTEILSISEHKLRADVTVDDYSPGQHEIKNEIKAVTYHQIMVEKRPDRWEARIIFDV